MLSKVINLVVFHIAWLACILGAAHGLVWVGVLVVLLSVLGHFVHARFDRGWAVLMLLAFFLGWGSDWMMLWMGE